jgi:hypothetical protein
VHSANIDHRSHALELQADELERVRDGDDFFHAWGNAQRLELIAMRVAIA